MLATRNLAVENAVSELPSECRFCNLQFPRNSLEKHEDEECEERIAGCKYHRIGCPWRGPMHEKAHHEQECGHPEKSGAEVMEALELLDQQVVEERKLYKTIFELLGYDKIIFNGDSPSISSHYSFVCDRCNFADIQLKPYRTDDFVHRLFYESSRFSAFSNQWVVKARINDSQKDPTQSSEREMTYQVRRKNGKLVLLLLIVECVITCPLVLWVGAISRPFNRTNEVPRWVKLGVTDSKTTISNKIFRNYLHYRVTVKGCDHLNCCFGKVDV
jgi:hypothetical protein